MREGVARDGSHLFGAFPYWAYTKLYDDDVKALYAYFMTRPPVRATAPLEHGSVSPEYSRPRGRVENSVFQAGTVPGRSGKERRMESRSLSG